MLDGRDMGRIRRSSWGDSWIGKRRNWCGIINPEYGGKMTESEAWVILAEEMDSGRAKSKFLCLNLEFAHIPGFYDNPAIAKIPYTVRIGMIMRIEAALDEGWSTAYHDARLSDNEQRQGRVLACLLFAEICKDD